MTPRPNGPQRQPRYQVPSRKCAWIDRAALRPAAIARMTVAAPVAMSPAAYNGGMASRSPDPIPPAESRRRRARVLREARSLGFVGRVEYRHAYSQSGGAQYVRGAGEGGDVLTVYAEAFDRDADPQDFSLRSILAHERGHQVLARHPRLSILLAGVSPVAEEVLASLLGARLPGAGPDWDALVDKATFEVLRGGATAEAAARVVAKLWDQLGGLL